MQNKIELSKRDLVEICSPYSDRLPDLSYALGEIWSSELLNKGVDTDEVSVRISPILEKRGEGSYLPVLKVMVAPIRPDVSTKTIALATDALSNAIHQVFIGRPEFNAVGIRCIAPGTWDRETCISTVTAKNK